ncbi:hypothetical protein C414_000440060 [Campylobacter jejuni subsp. jejuni 414]|nr:hypothetical protein C414_000440060 [Campylobacter jejuni subsp. jejuni 414]
MKKIAIAKNYANKNLQEENLKKTEFKKENFCLKFSKENNA